MADGVKASPGEGGGAEADPRVYLAAETTLLAWVRTGLGLMGVGFALARFGLFLREMQATQSHATVRAPGISVWSGVALVALGVLVQLTAAARHVMLVRHLQSGDWRPGVATQAVALAVVLAVVGAGMAAYLLHMR